MSTSTALIFNIFARNHTGPVVGGIGASFKKMGAGLIGAAGFAGVTAAIGSSISKAAQFDKTIRMAGAATGDANVDLKQFQAVALEMGAKTTFSAQGAADAMLELAKGGQSAAQIAGGVLKGTLTLAAAGGLELGDAATYMTNGLNAFGLKAKDAGQVAAALAGGANASTASVQSMGLALAQVGPGAVNAGLSIQETTAAIAAFDMAGIKGADAGTSLKTMLTRLVPMTHQSAVTMKELGLKFTDAHGTFLPLRDVAGQLQDKLKGLSQEHRTEALATMFGSDATRAASVLMKEGTKGIDAYIKATSDKAAADKMAKTATEGAAGAFEAFKGSVETLQIAFGLHLLPAVTKGTQALTGLINKVAAGVDPAFRALAPVIANTKGKLVELGTWFQSRALPVIVAFSKRLWSDLQPALKQIGKSFREDIKPALQNVIAKFREAWPTIQKVLKVLGGLAEIILTKVVPVVIKLAVKLNMFYINTLAKAFQITWKVIGALAWFVEKAISAGKAVGRFAVAVAGAMSAAWSAVKRGVSNAVDMIKSLPGKALAALGNLGALLVEAGKWLVDGFIKGIVLKAAEIPGVIAHSVVSAAKNAITSGFGIFSPSRVTKQYGMFVADGFALGILGGAAKVKLSAAEMVDAARQATEDRMQRFTDSLQKRVEKMKAAVERSKGIVADIRSTFRDAANVTGLDTGERGGFAGLMTALTKQRDVSTAFAKGVTQLRRRGLNSRTLQQLDDAGPGAIHTVEALLAGGKGGINQVNALVNQIGSAGKGLGEREALARTGTDPNARGVAKIGRVRIDLNLAAGADELTQAIVKVLRKQIRASGGNVQVALGTTK